MHPRAEATALYPHRVVEPRCIPADPRQGQPVQKTGAVTLQFCGVPEVASKVPRARARDPCRDERVGSRSAQQCIQPNVLCV